MRAAGDDTPRLPKDPAALRTLLLETLARCDTLSAELGNVASERDALAARNERLQHLLLKLQRRRFGRKSEQLPEDQLLFAFEEIEATLAANEAEGAKQSPALRDSRAKRRRAGRGRLPAHLPRVEVVLAPEATACPCCQGPLVEIGVDAGERLDVIPARFRVVVTKRPKLACRACSGVVLQAPAPARLIEGGMPTEATVAHVLVSRYADHLPLYRQAQILARQGIEIGRDTLASWVGRAAGPAPADGRLGHRVGQPVPPGREHPPLPVAPARDLLVVSREQHVGHLPAAVLGRPGVVRVLRIAPQRGAEGLLHGRVRVSEGARQLAQDGIGDHHRRQLAARQHVAADAQGVRGEVLDDPLVEALVAPAQEGLAAAHGGAPQPQAHMARDADAAGMGDAHAVEQEHVRRRLQLFEGFLQHRPLAKAQQAGHIGKGRRTPGQHRLDGQEARIGDDHDSGLGLLVLHAHVDPRHEADPVEVDGPVGDHLRSQLLLERDGLGGGEVPGMAAADLHGAGFEGDARLNAPGPGTIRPTRGRPGPRRRPLWPSLCGA